MRTNMETNASMKKELMIKTEKIKNPSSDRRR
jgi:hypothetical protein